MSEKKEQPTSGLGGAATPPAPGGAAAAIKSPPESADALADAPQGLKDAAAGKDLPDGEPGSEGAIEGAQEEAGALDFIVGPSKPVPFTVKTAVDTPVGLKDLIFHMHQLDGSKIDALEVKHSDGGGPFAKINRPALNAEKIAEATDKMVDTNGKELAPTDPAFIGNSISPAIAFERMFKFQAGVAEALAAEIDRMAGMTRDRVGIAEREIVAAAGNS